MTNQYYYYIYYTIFVPQKPNNRLVVKVLTAACTASL